MIRKPLRNASDAPQPIIRAFTSSSDSDSRIFARSHESISLPGKSRKRYGTMELRGVSIADDVEAVVFSDAINDAFDSRLRAIAKILAKRPNGRKRRARAPDRV